MAFYKSDFDQILTKADFEHFAEAILRRVENLKQEMLEEFKAQLQGRGKRPKFLTPAQFADLLAEKPGGRRMHRSTIRNWCKEGRIKATQEGGLKCSWLIPAEELDRIHREADAIEPQIPQSRR